MKNIKFNIIFWIVFSVLTLYLIIYMLGSLEFFGRPLFPIFLGLSSQINFYVLVSVFILLQIVIIMGFYKLYSVVFRGVFNVKNRLEKFSYSIQSYIK